MQRQAPRILVIEDDPVHRQLVRDILHSQGFEVLEADEGEAGLRESWSQGPDLVFLDINLPDVNGLEVARALKAEPESSGIPVIALTAMAMKGDRETCLQAGCDDYLAKPINFDVVVQKTVQWLQKPSGP